MSEFDFESRVARLQNEKNQRLALQREQDSRIQENNRQQETATAEARQLGQRYAFVLRGAGIEPVEIFEHVKYGKGQMVRPTGLGWVGQPRLERKSALQPVDRGWVLQNRSGYDDSAGSWSHTVGLSTDGELLERFKLHIPDNKGFENRYPGGVKGIILPHRPLGEDALRIVISEPFVDSVAWVAAGKGALK